MKARALSVAVAAGMTLVVSAAWAQFVPLHYGSQYGIVDEFGHILHGTPSTAYQFGLPVVTGDLVQIMHAEAGIFPPSTNGTPNANNPIVVVTRIGVGVDPGAGEIGKFGGSLSDLDRSNPSDTIQIFARAFNAPNLEDASFYADSQIYTVPVYGQTYGVFMAEIFATTQMLDSTDWDGDGLTRSWEKSYGSDPDNPDTDGDGMADGAEIRAGTGVTDPGSLLMMVQLVPKLPSDLDLVWDTVAGKSYQIEYTLDALTNNPAFSPIGGTVTATSIVSRTTVTNGLLTPNAHYRVRLVE